LYFSDSQELLQQSVMTTSQTRISVLSILLVLGNNRLVTDVAADIDFLVFFFTILLSSREIYQFYTHFLRYKAVYIMDPRDKCFPMDINLPENYISTIQGK